MNTALHLAAYKYQPYTVRVAYIHGSLRAFYYQWHHHHHRRLVMSLGTLVVFLVWQTPSSRNQKWEYPKCIFAQNKNLQLFDQMKPLLLCQQFPFLTLKAWYLEFPETLNSTSCTQHANTGVSFRLNTFRSYLVIVFFFFHFQWVYRVINNFVMVLFMYVFFRDIPMQLYYVLYMSQVI